MKIKLCSKLYYVALNHSPLRPSLNPLFVTVTEQHAPQQDMDGVRAIVAGAAAAGAVIAVVTPTGQ